MSIAYVLRSTFLNENFEFKGRKFIALGSLDYCEKVLFERLERYESHGLEINYYKSYAFARKNGRTIHFEIVPDFDMNK